MVKFFTFFPAITFVSFNYLKKRISHLKCANFCAFYPFKRNYNLIENCKISKTFDFFPKNRSPKPLDILQDLHAVFYREKIRYYCVVQFRKCAPVFNGHPGDATSYTFLTNMTLVVNFLQL